MTAIREAAETTPTSLWDQIIQRRIMTDDQVLAAISARFRLPLADLTMMDPKVRDSVPEGVARKHNVLPLRITDSTLDAATANPFDIDAEKMLAFATGREVRLLLSSPARIRERIEELYRGENLVSKLLGGLETGADVQQIEETQLDEGASADEASQKPIVRLVDMMLADGVTSRASDIHVEPIEGGVTVRYRIDGVLRQVMTVPRAAGIPLISRIKIMSGLDIADRLRPQDGRARIAINNDKVDLRVSTLPATYGEKVVIRILNQKSTVLSLQTLGLFAEERLQVERLLGLQGRHHPRDRADRLRQDDHALLRAPHDPERGRQHRHHRGPGRVPARQAHRPGADQREGRAHLLHGAPVDPPAGPRRRPGGRNPRRRDGADRGAGVADRPPGALHAAHQRRAELGHAPRGHGHAGVQDRGRASRGHRPAPHAAALPVLSGGPEGAGARARHAVLPRRDDALRAEGLPRLHHDRVQGTVLDRRDPDDEPRARAAHRAGRHGGHDRHRGAAQRHDVAVRERAPPRAGGRHLGRRAPPGHRHSDGGPLRGLRRRAGALGIPSLYPTGVFPTVAQPRGGARRAGCPAGGPHHRLRAARRARRRPVPAAGPLPRGVGAPGGRRGSVRGGS